MKRMWISLLCLLLMMLMLAAMPVPAFAGESRPVAENLELTTYCGVTVGGALSAFDPDGDVLRYEISTEPVRGTIALEEDGRFLYTPGSSRRGRDYFGYKAVDAEGNYSQEATVVIRILKQKKALCYADMQGRAEEYAAVALSEMGLFTGRQICGAYCFEPETPVSRGEFLSMCMALVDRPLPSAIYRTGYLDDAAIPAWQKAYASAAAINGVYQGLEQAAGRVFSGEEPISCAQAALLLDQALALEDVSYVYGYEEMDMQLAQACANLQANALIERQTTVEKPLTRADAAKLLTAASGFLDNK